MQAYLIKVQGQTCDVGIIHEAGDSENELSVEDIITLEDVGLLPNEVGVIDYDLPTGIFLKKDGAS